MSYLFDIDMEYEDSEVYREQNNRPSTQSYYRYKEGRAICEGVERVVTLENLKSSGRFMGIERFTTIIIYQMSSIDKA